MRITTLTLFALLLFCGQVNAQSTILLEDFEDSTVTYDYNSTVGQATADDISDMGNANYFGRFDGGTGDPLGIVYQNRQGLGYYGAQDADSANSGNIDDIVLDWDNIDITSYETLSLSWFVAEDTAGDGNSDWDITTSVRLAVQIDGGGYNQVFGIEGASSTVGNQLPRVDTNFNGVGDGTIITDTFAQFSTAIANGSSLDIRLTIEDLDTGDEDIGFDNLHLTGISTIPEPSGLVLLLAFGSTIGLCRRRKS